MVEDIKAGAVYSEIEFRLSKQTMSNMSKFEKRLDRIRGKIARLQTTKINVNTLGSGSAAFSARTVAGARKTPLAGLTDSIRKQEAFIAGKLITLENKFRAVKLPTKEIDKAKLRFDELTRSFKAGKILPQEFSVGMRKIGSDLADMHKMLNVPKPKFSRNLNAGFVSQLAAVAKAQDQLQRNISVKSDQFNRSLQNLQNLKPEQIQTYQKRFKSLVTELEKSPWAINHFRSQVASLDRDMRKANGITTMWGRQLRNLRHQFGRLQDLALPVMAGVAAGMFHFGRQMDKNSVMFKTTFGEDAAKEVAFLRRESDRLGISLLDNVKAYSKIAFSLKLMGIEGSKAKEVFTSFSEASLAFGMSQDDLNRAFKAIEQMYSKGTAQAEEIRGQLTEAGIPGVWQIAAKSMKMTSEEFDKAVTNREIQSADLIENLAKSLKKLAAPGIAEGLKTIEPTLGKFKNSFIDISSMLYNNFLPVMKNFLGSVRNVIDTISVVLDPISAVIGTALSTLMGVVEIITALMYDLSHNPRALMEYMFGNTKPENISNATSSTSTPAGRAEIVISTSEDAKKELDIRIKESHGDFWKNFDMNVG